MVISQCICISKHHFVHLEYVTFLFSVQYVIPLRITSPGGDTNNTMSEIIEEILECWNRKSLPKSSLLILKIEKQTQRLFVPPQNNEGVTGLEHRILSDKTYYLYHWFCFIMNSGTQDLKIQNQRWPTTLTNSHLCSWKIKFKKNYFATTHNLVFIRSSQKLGLYLYGIQ